MSFETTKYVTRIPSFGAGNAAICALLDLLRRPTVSRQEFRLPPRSVADRADTTPLVALWLPVDDDGRGQRASQAYAASRLLNQPVGKFAGPSGAGSAPVSTVWPGKSAPAMNANFETSAALYRGMIVSFRHSIIPSAHLWRNWVVSTTINVGLRLSPSSAKTTIVFLRSASPPSLVAGSHLSSR